MTSGALLGLVVAMSATGASAAVAPIWDRYPHLVCRLEDQVHCNRENCDIRPMTGMWDLAFSKSLVTVLGSGTTETIVGRNHDTDGQVAMDTILLSSSRTMSFLHYSFGSDDGKLNAQVVRATGPFTATIHMTCAEAK